MTETPPPTETPAGVRAPGPGATEPAEGGPDTRTADPPKPDEGDHPAAQASRYRHRLRETEGERDALAGRLAGMQRAEAERLAAAALSRPRDLWLDGRDVAELLDDEGNVDPAKVTAEVAAVLEGRPGLAVPPKRGPMPDHSQGSADKLADSGSGWSDVLKGGKRCTVYCRVDTNPEGRPRRHGRPQRGEARTTPEAPPQHQPQRAPASRPPLP